MGNCKGCGGSTMKDSETGNVAPKKLGRCRACMLSSFGFTFLFWLGWYCSSYMQMNYYLRLAVLVPAIIFSVFTLLHLVTFGRLNLDGRKFTGA